MKIKEPTRLWIAAFVLGLLIVYLIIGWIDGEAAVVSSKLFGSVSK